MEEIESMPVAQTPHVCVNYSFQLQNSTDSGYLSTLTPHTSSSCTLTVTGYRTRSSSGALSAKKHYRFRRDPIQCEKSQRVARRSKYSHLLNTSDPETHPVSEISSVEHDSVLEPSCVSINQSIGLVHSTPSCASNECDEILRNRSEKKWRALVPVTPASENRKLSELCITDLAATSEIKPKKLDFSYRGLVATLRSNSRSSSDYAGREKVDFLSLLGEESNHLHVVSKILAYLGPQDLCSVSMVSTAWRRICERDLSAKKRKMSYILCKQNIKENLRLAKKMKHEEELQTSPKSRHYARKGCLLDVQNLLHSPKQLANSPPVSPSKVKFHSFVKVSKTCIWKFCVAFT